jgi:hypothetical protein
MRRRRSGPPARVASSNPTSSRHPASRNPAARAIQVVDALSLGQDRATQLVDALSLGQDRATQLVDALSLGQDRSTQSSLDGTGRLRSGRSLSFLVDGIRVIRH